MKVRCGGGKEWKVRGQGGKSLKSGVVREMKGANGGNDKIF